LTSDDDRAFLVVDVAWAQYHQGSLYTKGGVGGVANLSPRVRAPALPDPADTSGRSADAEFDMRGLFDNEISFIADQEIDFPDGDVSFEAGVDTPDLQDLTRQGAVVDSNLVVFPVDTPASVRNAVCNWTLFAQRAATKEVDPQQTKEWVDAYLDVLLHTGWSLREDTSAWSEEQVVGSVVHQKILDLVAVALGPVPGALALVTAALTSLQGMNEKSKWITLFNRRAKSAASTGFSVANVDPQADGSAQLRSIDFRVEARKTFTQFLFFQFTSQEALMFKRSVVLFISADALKELAPSIEQRVMAFAKGNIAAFDI
jgi:hypothetical protein